MRFAAVGLGMAVASAADAGMPSLTLTDLAALRLQTLSFFAAAFLLCAWLVQRLWNGLRKEFPKLPALGFRAALALLAAWGFVFGLALTMISGARELLTPGAWERDGVGYKLKPDEPAAPAGIEERLARLRALRTALWAYAAGHGGKLPASDTDPAIAAELWRSAHESGTRFLYVPGRTTHDGAGLVASEPRLWGDERFGLFADGSVRLVEPATPGAKP